MSEVACRVFKAGVLEILVEMTLMAVQNEQPVSPHPARLVYMSKCYSHTRPSALLVQPFSETESLQLRSPSASLYHAEIWTLPL
jgi:hypothetical protein